jgi:hypothetical protein
MIQHIQISTLEFSSSVLGNNSMVSKVKEVSAKFLPMLLHQEERMLTYVYLLTLTILVTH